MELSVHGAIIHFIKFLTTVEKNFPDGPRDLVSRKDCKNVSPINQPSRPLGNHNQARRSSRRARWILAMPPATPAVRHLWNHLAQSSPASVYSETTDKDRPNKLPCRQNALSR